MPHCLEHDETLKFDLQREDGQTDPKVEVITILIPISFTSKTLVSQICVNSIKVRLQSEIRSISPFQAHEDDIFFHKVITLKSYKNGNDTNVK